MITLNEKEIDYGPATIENDKRSKQIKTMKEKGNGMDYSK
jgi:hypothetical protein